MRVALILAGVSTAVMLALPAASAAAQNQSRGHSQAPAWCLNGGGQNTNAGGCVYRTLDPCVHDRTGQGGHCDPNPNAPPPFGR
jgi:Protein of unknown function (DUF3551)